jgi:hypothetical protein
MITLRSHVREAEGTPDPSNNWPVYEQGAFFGEVDVA